MKSLTKTFGALAAGLVLTSGCEFEPSIENPSSPENNIQVVQVGQSLNYTGIERFYYAGMPNKDSFSLVRDRDCNRYGSQVWNEFYSATNLPRRVGNVEILEVTQEQLKFRGIK